MAVGTWFAEAAIENFVEKVRSIMEDCHDLRAKAGSKLHSVQAALPRIKILLDVTERKAFSNTKFRAWLRQFKDAVCEAEDLLDDFEIKRIQETNRGKISSAVSFGLKYLRNLILSDTDLERLTVILTKLDQVTDDGVSSFQDLLTSAFADEEVLPRRRPTRPVFVGRDQHKRRLLDMILYPNVPQRPQDGAESSTGVSVISVVGAAGVGKTILAQEIYNDSIVKESFVLRGWVFASHSCNSQGLDQDIAHSFETEQQENLQRSHSSGSSLVSVIQNKKFFLVLDDVHDNMHQLWGRLKPTLAEGANGSVVLLISRSEEIKYSFGETAQILLDHLPFPDLMTIFEHHAFGKQREASLQSIGKQVVQKLHGLPLFAEAIGRLLRQKLDEVYWQKISTSNWWYLSEDDDDVSLPLVAIMWEHLCDINLINCLYYCSIFPSGYLFEKNMLIHMWIASFMQRHDGIGMEVTEKVWFDELFSRSFFQPTVWKNRYLMPDMIREPLLHTFSGEECHAATELGEQERGLQEYRHLAINFRDFNVHLNLRKGNRLRTILFFDGHRTSQPHEAFANILSHPSELRVLDFSYTEVKLDNFPCSINRFKSLKFLDLSFTGVKVLPDSLCELLLLQVLGLRGCQFNKLPDKINRLVNLRFLYAEGHTVSLIYKIGQLINLQGLQEFPVRRMEGHKITELKGLNQVSGQLCIGNLEEVESTDIVGDAELFKKRHLKKLAFRWGLAAHATASDDCTRTLDGLKPNSNLEELKIQFYMGVEFPAWMKDVEYFTNLRQIHLIECKQLTELPPLGQIPSLVVLILQGLSKLEKFGEELYGNSPKVFPSLEELTFLDMQNWEKWSNRETGLFIPKLRKVIIDRCPRLSEAPLHSFRKTLLELDLSDCDLILASGTCLHGLGNLKRLKIFTYTGSITIPCSSLTSLVVLNVSNNQNELNFDGGRQLLTNIKIIVINGCVHGLADETKPVLEDMPSSGILPPFSFTYYLEEIPKKIQVDPLVYTI